VNKNNDGGPAFPVSSWFDFKGMTLRDWFAGMALQGVLSGKFEGEMLEEREVKP
jgi:hypothetical protein